MRKGKSYLIHSSLMFWGQQEMGVFVCNHLISFLKTLTGKRGAAVYVQSECSRTTDPQHLKELLNTLLNPQKPIEELETVDWIKWLIAGGKTPVEFASVGKSLICDANVLYEYLHIHY